ncbi:MAG: peptidoglycan DD-metalloendopeptidase family protein [Acidobacteria bacterium]|nr:peptidoglycan DD-metalloendopeptidase family protein [Acidobacteriota bacterium]
MRWNTIKYLIQRNTTPSGGPENIRTARREFQQGLGLAPERGPGYPVSTGTVVGVQRNDVGKYGKTINLKFSHNGKTYYAFYSHLSEVWCSEGQEITDINSMIGAVGDTGNAKGIAAGRISWQPALSWSLRLCF